MAGSSWVVSQKPSPLLPSTLLASLGLKLPPEPIFKPSPLSPPKPPDPPDPPPGRSCLEALVTISSSPSPPLLHHAALAGISVDRGQICTLFSEQPRLPLPPLPFNLTSAGLVSSTLLCIVQWYRTYPLLVLIYFCMRFVPQYEDFTLIRLDQSYVGMVVMSLIGSRHLCRQSLAIVGSGFGVNLLVSGYLSDHFYGESDLPCIEDGVRLVLTFSVAKDGGEVEVLCDKTSQPLQQLVQKIEEHQDTFACLPNAFWMSMSSCYGMEWFMEEPLMASIHHGSSFRPVVSYALVAEELALKTAICAALAVGVSRLAYFSNWQELPLLLNVGGHTFAVDDILVDIRRMKNKFLPFPFFMCLSFENSSVACIFSSFNGV
ncbi:hypothetical protein ISN45_Aa03g025920 [Arabidopsis thaliana x Arabidopsis arenosa]|uniref:Uncharacterized protein n=1 Tax=Arabidopsis thaliana x Arabidopsis arenosa TaxID=1240361 RepID=A0A8T2AX50_9BRAS|nr:hypothetical protein ISN45_Aa03g025920 [Arabidopsis thaliana x Arabidopsis arenosa]